MNGSCHENVVDGIKKVGRCVSVLLGYSVNFGAVKGKKTLEIFG